MNPRKTKVEEKIYPAEMAVVLQSAQLGDGSVVPELRAFLAENAEVWQSQGDLGAHVEQSVIEVAAGHSLLAEVSIRMYLANLKRQLAIVDPEIWTTE